MCDKSALLKRGLAVANFCLWVIGAALMVSGLWMVIDEAAYSRQHAMEQAVPGVDVATYGLYVFIAVGAVVVFGIVTIGCCVATQNKLCPYVFFIILVSTATVGVFAGCVLIGIARSRLLDNADLPRTLYNDIIHNFTSVDVYVKFGTLQYTFQCCGALRPQDYRESVWGKLSGQYLPPTCCTIPVTSQYILEPPNNYTACILEAKRDSLSNYEHFYPHGCIKIIKTWFAEQTSLLIGLGVAFCVLGILSLIISVCLCQPVFKAYTRPPI
ncbi:tetraspanin-11 [Lingula anatina]|uniref:Tetraspanin n=1 Tax=Lingula anatina TaxID=7574 RepID=A0A1S3I2Z9_LINAN|nr:tetraspanin-11 [Lingula anatina]|eukprot:XP_013392608.1 tetraspanin-11 [Lingula anatina]